LGELRDRPHLADLRPDLQQRLASWEVTRVDGGEERLQLVEPAHGDDVALIVPDRLRRRRQGDLRASLRPSTGMPESGPRAQRRDLQRRPPPVHGEVAHTAWTGDK